MTNPTKEKILGEFEDKFVFEEAYSETSSQIRNRIKFFLSQKLDEYAMEIVKKCLPEEKEEIVTDVYNDAAAYGYNSARIQMLDKAKEILNVK